MRARFLLPLLTLCCLALPAQAQQIVVIVHADSPLHELTPQQLSDLYLGRTRVLDGKQVMALDLPRDSQIRGQFFQLLNGMDLRRVNAYWARLQFSGDVQPPPVFPDSKSVGDIVRRNPSVVGYVEADAVPSGVRILLKL